MLRFNIGNYRAKTQVTLELTPAENGSWLAGGKQKYKSTSATAGQKTQFSHDLLSLFRE
jgi:hypothetical protein